MATVPLYEKLRYWAELAIMHVQSLSREPDFTNVMNDAGVYDALLHRHAGKRLANARALEIGFGQRPFRLFWLIALGHDVEGIDIDRPVLFGGLREFVATYRHNGLERAAKSLVRYFLFDRRKWRAFGQLVERHTGKPFRMPVERLFAGDAGDSALWTRLGKKYDLIYSEDVFEHIPEKDLDAVVQLMAAQLGENGIAVISPMIFTGIAGGHSLEWYPHEAEREFKRRSEPWEHLRGDRFPADTFLNRVPRAAYRAIFARSFDIVEETVLMPELGRRFLTSAVRRELADYTDDELFSNKVRFVLRIRQDQTR